jgi:Flp pilus assembly pilin Flp
VDQHVIPSDPHRRDAGAGLVEYALLVALIALVCFAAIQFFGGNLGSKYSSIGSSVTAAGS